MILEQQNRLPAYFDLNVETTALALPTFESRPSLDDWYNLYVVLCTADLSDMFALAKAMMNVLNVSTIDYEMYKDRRFDGPIEHHSMWLTA